jgi:membrane protease YdiL (CAAX protease family)
MTNTQHQRRQAVLLGIGFEAGLGGLAWLLGWLMNQPPLERFRWSIEDTALGVSASLPMLLIFLLLFHFPVGPFASIRQFGDEVVRFFFKPCKVLDLALISLTAGWGEEMLFRGVLQGAFSRWLGPWTGLALASALFALMHPISVVYILLVFLFGLYLGYLWMASDNLLVVVITHGLYDFLALVYLLRGSHPPSQPANSTKAAESTSCSSGPHTNS